jgi:CRP-like cAMP-binding protein
MLGANLLQQQDSAGPPSFSFNVIVATSVKMLYNASTIAEVIDLQELIAKVNSPLFYGIQPEDRKAMLGCIGYHIGTFKKGDIVAFEEENIKHIGILLSGAVDMIKEDLWGNKTMLVRMRKDELFGETFACGSDNLSVVTFMVSEDAKILFLPFDRVMHSCTMACQFHHRLIENMVHIIADKNRDLMRKVEVVSKRTIREKLLAYLSIQAQIQESRYFEIPLGRVELAEYLCVDRSALTRELAKMKEDGLIDYDRNCFRMR